MKTKPNNIRLTAGGFLVGAPTLRSAAEIREMQRSYVNRSNPNAFYFLVDPRGRPRIVWQLNTQVHFYKKSVTYKEFFAAIHPQWLDLYVSMAMATFKFLESQCDATKTRKMTLTANVPIKHKDGKYYWYSHVSFPVSFDENGYMVEYLVEFHRLADFHRIIPACPQTTFQNEVIEEANALIYQACERVLPVQLQKIFSKTSYKVLKAYQQLIEQGGKPGREAVADHLSVKVTTLDKANVRLLNQAAIMFPSSVLGSVADLAAFVNDFTGGVYRVDGQGG